MRISYAFVLVTLASTLSYSGAALAHPGHGATPAHVHVAGLPIDIGAIAIMLVVGAAALGTAWAARKKRA